MSESRSSLWQSAFLFVAIGVANVVGAGALQAQSLSFTDITVAAGLDLGTSGAHGVMFGDADGDGRPDLYVTYNDVPTGYRVNKFYRNRGGGLFVEEAAARGIENFSGGSHGAVWADLDNDGDYDLVVGDTYGNVNEPPAPTHNRVYRNDGGRFVDVTPPDIARYADYTRGVNAIDFDRNGLLDIFAVNGYVGTFEPLPDRNELYRNLGGFNFAAITTGAAITAPAGQHALDLDFDGDGDMDLIAANWDAPLNVLRNDGGVFTAVAPESIGILHHGSTGMASGDWDNDGDLDLVVVDQDSAGHVAHLYRNNGNGTFVYLGGTPHFSGYSVGLADLDNDGDLDLVLPGYPVVYLNDGTGLFAPGPAVSGPGAEEDTRSIAVADIDGDGDVDFVWGAKHAVPHLFRNNLFATTAARWLKVRLVSPLGQAGAYGAKLYVYRPGTRSLIGMREAHSQSSYLAQDDAVLHVGLGAAPTVDVEVVFLDGTRVTRSGVSANQTLTVDARSNLQLPQAPRNAAAAVTGSTVTVTWEPPTGGSPLTTYVIEAGSAPGRSDVLTFTTGSLATSITATAGPGTYYIRIRAQNLVGLSPPSNEVIVAVGTGAPSPPVGLMFTRSGNLVTLQWSPPLQGAVTSYLVEAGTTSGDANLGIFDVGLTTSVSATAASGTYFVRVRARNGSGASAPSNEVIIQVP